MYYCTTFFYELRTGAATDLPAGAAASARPGAAPTVQDRAAYRSQAGLLPDAQGEVHLRAARVLPAGAAAGATPGAGGASAENLSGEIHILHYCTCKVFRDLIYNGEMSSS